MNIEKLKYQGNVIATNTHTVMILMSLSMLCLFIDDINAILLSCRDQLMILDESELKNYLTITINIYNLLSLERLTILICKKDERQR